MRILVTGSNGFIGKNLVRYLKDREHYVIGLGRKAESASKTDEYYQADLSTEESRAVLSECISGVDAVMHVAADMRKEPYAADVIRANCMGTQMLIEACIENKVSAFVQLSSLPVIDVPRFHPITEDHPLRFHSIYHATKAMQEGLAQYAFDYHSLSTASFRISAPVGIGMNKNTIMSVFITNAVNGKDLTVFGNGTRIQSYIHVNDISSALLEACIHPDSLKGNVFNLSSENRISNIDLAREVIRLTGSSSKIVFSGKPDPCDTQVWDASLNKIKSAIPWEPKTDLETIILEYAGYVKAEHR